jgi:hypothetical protein
MTTPQDELVARRDAAHREAQDILNRAQDDLTGPDATRFGELANQIETLNERLDEIRGGAVRAANAASTLDRLAAQPVERPASQRGPLSRDDADVARAFRSAIFAKNPQPIEVFSSQLGDEWPADVPEVQADPGVSASTPVTR